VFRLLDYFVLPEVEQEHHAAHFQLEYCGSDAKIFIQDFRGQIDDARPQSHLGNLKPMQ